VPPTPAPNPSATPEAADPAAAPKENEGASSENSEETDGEQKVSLSQKELNDLIKKRLDQQKRQLETAAEKAERQRQEQLEEAQRQQQEEQERKEAETLASQQKYQELAEKTQRTLGTVTAERDTLRGRVNDLEAKIAASNEALGKYVEAESQGVPDYILPLLERMELPERLAYLVENRDRLKPVTPAPAPAPQPRQTAPVPTTPRPAEVTGPSDAELAQARAAVTEQYRRSIF
jgi:hypothetical protein